MFKQVIQPLMAENEIYRRVIHPRDWEPASITLQALSLVEKMERT
jgi:hypothetical protein